MSDHDEVGDTSGYLTPVPELDDHRHQSASVALTERPRRGTFDSLYAMHQTDGDILSSTRVVDFEHAVDDEDGPDSQSPAVNRPGRRPTVDSALEPRDLSPPNSVKAFAEARRRERELSFSDLARPERPDRGKVSEDAEYQLQRAGSVMSRPSHRSRPFTAADDAASLATNKTAEEDVCFPMTDDLRGYNLHIDFDYLENYIRAESEVRRIARLQEKDRVFLDLRASSSHLDTTTSTPMVTANGDFVDLPTSEMTDEKAKSIESDAQPKTAAAHATDPGRVSFFSSAWESTIHAADLEGLVLPGEDIRGLFSFPKGETDGVWWLNVNKPGAEEVRAICRAFGVHPLTIEDITTQEAREKIELFPSYYFACFRSFYLNVDGETQEKEYVPFNIYVIVFREGTLSFSYAGNSHASHVRQRITMLKDYVALSSDWICYALIDDIVDCFAPVINKIEQEADQIEDDVFVARTNDMAHFLRNIGTARKNVMGLMRLLGGKADVLKGFTKRCNENYKVTPRMDIGLYLGDIQDHVVTMMTNLSHYEKILSRAHSNYLAQLSIDHIQQGTNTNAVLSKITLLASIIVPLNVITGLFGMNVRVPWGDVDNLNAFFGVVGCLVGFALLTFLLARRLRLV